MRDIRSLLAETDSVSVISAELLSLDNRSHIVARSVSW